MTDAKKLLQMKERYEQMNKKATTLSGQRDSLHSELKRRFQCDTIQTAKARLKVMDKDIKKLSSEIEKGMERVEKYLRDSQGGF